MGETLVALLASPSPRERFAACVAAAGEPDRAGERAVLALSTTVEDDHPEVRKAAVRALGRWLAGARCHGGCGGAAVEALARAARSADPETREWAVWALGQAPAEVGCVLPVLAHALRDACPDVRQAAAEILCARPDCPPALRLEASLDADPCVRAAAADAVRRRGRGRRP